MTDHRKNRHLSDEESQELVDQRLAGEKALPDHLEQCGSCLTRLERFESLFALLDSVEVTPAPPSIESAVMGRLFPVKKGRFAFLPSPMPRWAPVAAMVALTLSTAFSFSIFRLFGVALGPVVEMALKSRLEYFVTPLSLAAGALNKISALGTWAGHLWGDSQVTLSALLHLWDAPEIKLLILASAGIYSMIALGWGSRLLLTRTRGGIHNAMLA